MKKTYDFDEARSYLKISINAMFRLIETGELPAAKITCWVFRESDLEDYLAKQISIQTKQRREAYQAGRVAQVNTPVAEVRKGRRRVYPKLPSLPE